jgi:hypothetical protein
MKRGQVTVFIILGVLIIFSAALAFFLMNLSTPENNSIPDNTQIEFFIQECLDKAGENSLKKTFSHGGYYKPLQKGLLNFYQDNELFSVPSYFESEKSSLISLNQFKQEISRGAEKELLVCLEDFSPFTEKGILIQAGSPKIRVDFSNEEAIFLLEYPLTITTKKQEIAVSTFSTKIPVEFKTHYTILKDFLKEQETSPKEFLVGGLSYGLIDSDAHLEISDSEKEEGVVMISLKIPPNEIPLNFLLNFDYGSVENLNATESESNFSLIFDSDWTITTSGIHKKQIEATGDGLVYSLDTEDFSISQTGEITLDTNGFPNDESIYYVSVENKYGEGSSGPLYLKINIQGDGLPEIKNPLSVETAVKKSFVYQIESVNTDTFTSETYLFDISETGLINFTPQESGEHSIRINAINEKGLSWIRWDLIVK